MTGKRRLLAPSLLLRRTRQRQVLIALSCFFGFGLVSTIAAAVSLDMRYGFDLLGKAGLVAGVSLMIALQFGALLGTDRAPAAGADRAAATAQSNANFLAVADWSTKMIIGAGLALLAIAPSAFRQLGDALALDRSFEGRQLGWIIAAYFASCGAAVGYLFARLRAAEYAERPKLLEDGLQIALQLPLDPDKWKGLTVAQTEALEVVARTPREYLRNRIELLAWARTQFAFGNPARARDTLWQLLREDKDPGLEMELEEMERRLHDRALLQGPVRDDQPPPDKPMLPTEAINAMFQALYEAPPAGFRRAIELGEQFADTIQSPQLWAYLACGYGQQHEYLKARAGHDKASLDSIANRALFAIQQAVDLDPSWRPTLRGFWNPDSPGKDDDLVTFFGDARFAAVLDPETAKSTVSIAQDIRAAFTRPSGARYAGAVEAWLTRANGAPVKQDTGHFLVAPNEELRLVAQFAPMTEQSAGSAFSLDGEDQPVVDFVLQPNCPEITGFSPDSLTLAVPIAERSTQPDFSFTAPVNEGDHEIFLQVTQAGRTANMIKVLLRVPAT